MNSPRIVAFPASGIGYIDGFYKAVAAQGATVVEGVFAGRWLMQSLRAGDLVHLHWPSFLYQVPGRLALLRSFTRFVLLLGLMRWRGARFAWTAHNLLPHQASAIPALDRLARRIVLRLADWVLVHGEQAAQLLQESFPFDPRKLLLIPHGHFAGQYAGACTKPQARALLGLKQQTPVLLMLGQCKPYKNVEGLIRLHRQRNDEVQLLIAGSFADPGYEAKCRREAAGDPRIHLHAGYIDDDRIQTFLAAADLFVIPYREILTSGSAVLAASHGLPVVSIDKGFLRDFVTAEMGILYPPDEERGLVQAIDQALSRRWDADRITALALAHRYEDAARIMLEAAGRWRPAIAEEPR